MSLIPYPNVPNVPGVPNVLRKLPAGPPPVLGTVAGIAQLVRSFTAAPVWGVFENIGAPSAPQASDGLEEVVVTGITKLKPVVVPDSIRDFGYFNEWTLSSAPVQQGSFADYNRVNNPFEVTLRMTKGGSERERENFIKQIESLGTTKLYKIITPEKTYFNVNIMRFEIHREGERGAYWMPEVDLTFREIRVVTAQYSRTSIANPISANAANVQNIGTQQSLKPFESPIPKPSFSATAGTF